MINYEYRVAFWALIVSIVSLLALGSISYGQYNLTQVSNQIQESQERLAKISLFNTLTEKNISYKNIMTDLGVAFTDYDNGNLDDIKKLFDQSIKPETPDENRFIQKIFNAANAFEEALISLDTAKLDNQLLLDIYGDTIKRIYKLMTVQFTDDTIKALKPTFGNIKTLLELVESKNVKEKTMDLIYFVKTAKLLLEK